MENVQFQSGGGGIWKSHQLEGFITGENKELPGRVTREWRSLGNRRFHPLFPKEDYSHFLNYSMIGHPNIIRTASYPTVDGIPRLVPPIPSITDWVPEIVDPNTRDII